MEQKFKQQEVGCVAVFGEEENYDFAVLLGDANDQSKHQLGITYMVKLRSSLQETYDENMTMGKWTFRNVSLFVRNSEEQESRIDFQVQCDEDPSYHNFYMVGKKMKYPLEVANCIAELVSVVTGCTDVDDIIRKREQIKGFVIGRSLSPTNQV